MITAISCPVCGHFIAEHKLICSECGYNRTDDFAIYLTLGDIPSGAVPASFRKMQREAAIREKLERSIREKLEKELEEKNNQIEQKAKNLTLVNKELEQRNRKLAEENIRLAGTISKLQYELETLRQRNADLKKALSEAGSKNASNSAFGYGNAFSSSFGDADLNSKECKVNKLPDVGENITFGKYMHGGEGYKYPLTWNVLAKEWNQLLLLTADVIDCKCYNDTKTSVQYKNSSVYKWMNEKLYSTEYFSKEEFSAIQLYTAKSDFNPIYKSIYGGDFTSHLFLLSVNEFDHYCKGKPVSIGVPTPYVLSKSGRSADKTHAWWWLRTPGFNETQATYVSYNGEIRFAGERVNNPTIGIRPAMWVDGEKLLQILAKQGA